MSIHRCTRPFNPSSLRALSLFSHSFPISFSSFLWNDRSNSPLFLFFPLSLFIYPLFIPLFLQLLSLSSLRWGSNRPDLFSFVFFLFLFPHLFPCRSLYLCLCLHAVSWWMWRAVYRGMFFNLLLLTKTIQLASHCLSNLKTALVKCYLW